MQGGGAGLLYAQLGRTGFMRNIAYRWSHLINVVASAVFGYIYISLWQAVAPVSAPGDPYVRSTMVSMMILAQVFAWISIFIPAGLGIHNSVRTGSIALEMARPVPYFPMTLAREAGSLGYQALYRSLPLALIFALTPGFPRPGSWSSLLLAVPSVLLAGYIGLTMTYTVGISSLWTTEIRWAHWAYGSVSILFSGGWVPADMLPGVLGRVAPYLPFASLEYYPIRTYLGMSGAGGLLVQAAWAAALTLWCRWLTARALLRVVVQGG